MGPDLDRGFEGTFHLFLARPSGRNQYFVTAKRKCFEAGVSHKEAVETSFGSVNLSRESMVVPAAIPAKPFSSAQGLSHGLKAALLL